MYQAASFNKYQHFANVISSILFLPPDFFWSVLSKIQISCYFTHKYFSLHL